MGNNYYKTAVKEARKLRKQLEEKNQYYREELELFKSGKVGTWRISTPVYDPISLVRAYNLITLSSEIADAHVFLRLPSITTKIVNAYFKKYEKTGKKDRYEIVVARHNPCYTRFFACKELMHIYIYTPEAATTSVGDLNLVLSHLLNSLVSHEDINEQISSEHAGYFGATELLIPSEIVPMLYKAKVALEATEEFASTANLEIAKKLGVPENVVEFRLNETINEFFSELWED